MDLPVVCNPAQRLGGAHELVLDSNGKVIERFIGSDIVRLRISLHKDAAQAVFRYQLRHPGRYLRRIAG